MVGTLIWVSANYQRFAIDTQNASTATIATFLVKQRVFQDYRKKTAPFIDEWARLSTLINGVSEKDPAKARIAAERIMQTLEVAEGRGKNSRRRRQPGRWCERCYLGYAHRCRTSISV